LISASIIFNCQLAAIRDNRVNTTASLKFYANNNDTFQNLKNQFNKFSAMLADDVTSLEDECNEIALKNDVAINIGFGESSIGFSQAAISSFACSKISCLNSYFEKNDKIDDNSYCCVHVCDSKINEFCKNGAKCLADVPNEYEPKCA